MTKYIIEDNVPIPSLKSGSNGRRPSEFTSTLNKLKRGQSFRISAPSKSASARVHSWSRAHKTQKKFAVRAMNSNEARIWRIK